MLNRTRLLVVSGGLVSLMAASFPALAADNSAPVKQTKANYELAAQWTPAKMGKLVLESAGAPQRQQVITQAGKAENGGDGSNYDRKHKTVLVYS